MKEKSGGRIVSFCLMAVMLLSLIPFRALAADGQTPNVNHAGISIDGSFGDWDGIPKTVISWDNQNDGQRVEHIGALCRNGNTLYVMFQESADYQYYDTPKRVLQLQNMEIDVGFNVSPKVLKVLPIDSSGSIIGSPSDSMQDLPNGVHRQFGVYVYEKNGGLVKVGTQVAYRVQKEEDGHRKIGDAVEFAIDLELLAKYWKGNVEDIKTISVINHWLGNQMTLSGSSSYALPFLLIAVPIAIAGYAAYAKNKKKNGRSAA